jgi:folylpolyglutamate synthase/dihydropteroate synthase
VAVVFGGLKDKDLGSMLSVLKGEALALFLTRPSGAGERAAEPESLRDAAHLGDGHSGEVLVVRDAREAVRRAADVAGRVGGVVLVVGSLAMGGEVLEALRDGTLAGGARGR